MKNNYLKKLRILVSSRFFLPIVIFFIATFFYTFNIDGQGLSLDESETAAVGRAIFKYGVPASWDGLNIIPVADGLEFKLLNGVYVWRWHPWMHHYLFALGDLIFNGNILYGRIPFAFIGALTVVVLYGIANYIFKRKSIALLLALQLLFLLPFFLYSRQIRYYAPNALFALTSFFFLIALYQNKWKSEYRIPFFISTLLLFFTNYITWGTTCLFLGGLALLRKRRDVVLLLVIEGVIALIWYLTLEPFKGNFFMQAEFQNYPSKIVGIFSYLNNYIFPFLLLPFLLFFKKFRKLTFFILAFIFVKIFLYEFFYFKHARYLMDIFPLFILLFGFFYSYFITKKKYLILISFFVIATTTSLFHVPISNFVKQEKVEIRFWPNYFSIELNQKYESALNPLAEYMKKNYRKGDLFVSTGNGWDIYNLSGVPGFYPTGCNKSTIIPEKVTDVSKIRWIVFVNKEDQFAHVEQIICLEKQYADDFKKQFRKVELVPGKYYSVNDPDVSIRHFPPYGVDINTYIVLYERN